MIILIKFNDINFNFQEGCKNIILCSYFTAITNNKKFYNLNLVLHYYPAALYRFGTKKEHALCFQKEYAGIE